MPNGIWALALASAMQVGTPGPSETPNYPALDNAYNQYGFEGQFEQRFPFDNQQNWTHGYFQEIPPYGGHPFFRPYNYKDILSQSQVSAGWGQSPVLPYSQQFWHKYHDQATMLKLSRSEGQMPQAPEMSGPEGYYAEQANYVEPVGGSINPAPRYSVPVNTYPAARNPVNSGAPQMTGPALQPRTPQSFNAPAYAPR